MPGDETGSRLLAVSFDRFAVVLFGSPEVITAVQAIREHLPPSGRPILPAHVTVKGTFVNPVDLDRTAETIRAVSMRHAPISLKADACRVWSDSVHCSAWLAVEDTEPLGALHRELVGALADHGATIYHGEAEGLFRPHLTVVQEVAADQEAAIRGTIERVEHRFTWTAHEVALVGRRGGTTWETLATAPLLA